MRYYGQKRNQRSAQKSLDVEGKPFIFFKDKNTYDNCAWGKFKKSKSKREKSTKEQIVN